MCREKKTWAKKKKKAPKVLEKLKKSEKKMG